MLKWMGTSITQGGADAFVQVELQTGLINLTSQAYRIRRIEYGPPRLIETADNDYGMSITRKSMAVLPTFTSQALIHNIFLARAYGSTVGNIDQDLYRHFSFERDLEMVIVEDPLYVQLDSTGTGAVNGASIRIGYELRSITTTERLALIAASLA